LPFAFWLLALCGCATKSLRAGGNSSRTAAETAAETAADSKDSNNSSGGGGNANASNISAGYSKA
jgi:hypothetical protein